MEYIHFEKSIFLFVIHVSSSYVVCPSEMEHRVGAVTAGTRASLNVDFWDVDAAADRRSDFDRY